MSKDWYSGCTDDPKWRINHLYYIVSKEHGVIRFKMNSEQEYLFDNLHTRNTILKARQLGMSTLVAIMMLDSCLFNPHFKAGVIDKGLDDARAKMGKMKLAYEFMETPPPFTQVDHVQDPQDREDIAMFCKSFIADTENGVQATFNADRADFSNGSEIRVGTSLRSDTIKLLHISEFGWVAHNNPIRANEIISGGLETVPTNSVVIMESTHEGAQTGKNYSMLREAMKNNGKELNPLDFKFFFFSWWQHPEYRIEQGAPVTDPEYLKYFARLESEEGIVLDDAQKRWYVSKARTLEGRMTTEYPSTPQEAFLSQVEGSIYGSIIMKLRTMTPSRVDVQFEVDTYHPLYVSWDIGMSDYMTMWLFQVGGDGKYYVVDYYCANDQPLAHYVDKVRAWEREYGQTITRHLLPHDAATRDRNQVSFQQDLRKARFSTVVIPRVSNLWHGIQATKEILRYCVFHERVNKMLVVDGNEYMSGLNALESYHTGGDTSSGVERMEPIHDLSSHGADSFRYFAEAIKHGFVSRDRWQKAKQRQEQEDWEEDILGKKKHKKRTAKGCPVWS